MTRGVRRWGTTGPDVLLLHCSLAHALAWQGVAQQLQDDFCLIAPDMVGHGAGPDWAQGRDFHDQSTDLAAGFLSDGAGHLVGHSFGATVALRLAIERPAQVQSLTLIEPVLFAAADGTRVLAQYNDALRDVPILIEQGKIQAATRLFLSVWGGGTPFEALSPKQARYMTDRIWVTEAPRHTLHDDAAHLLPRLGQVACPTLLLEGAASHRVVHAILDGLETGLARSLRATIPEAGHMAPISHPGEVAAQLRAFWAAI